MPRFQECLQDTHRSECQCQGPNGHLRKALQQCEKLQRGSPPQQATRMQVRTTCMLRLQHSHRTTKNSYAGQGPFPRIIELANSAPLVATRITRMHGFQFRRLGRSEIINHACNCTCPPSCKPAGCCARHNPQVCFFFWRPGVNGSWKPPRPRRL